MSDPTKPPKKPPQGPHYTGLFRMMNPELFIKRTDKWSKTAKFGLVAFSCVLMSLSYSNYQWKITQREKKLAGLRSDGERLEQATDFHEHYDRRRRIMGGGRGERGGMYDNLADSPWGEQHPYQEEEVEEGEAADSRTRKTVVRRIIRRRSGDDL